MKRGVSMVIGGFSGFAREVNRGILIGYGSRASGGCSARGVANGSFRRRGRTGRSLGVRGR